MTAKKPTHWVVSTLSTPMNYTTYGNGGGDLPLAVGNVSIAGGANIPDKYMRHPNGGVITPVTSDEVEALQANEVFKLHVENGFIKILDKEPKNSEVASSDLEGRDQSAPLVDQDFEAAGQEAPANSVARSSRKA